MVGVVGWRARPLGQGCFGAVEVEEEASIQDGRIQRVRLKGRPAC